VYAWTVEAVEAAKSAIIEPAKCKIAMLKDIRERFLARCVDDADRDATESRHLMLPSGAKPSSDIEIAPKDDGDPEGCHHVTSADQDTDPQNNW